MRDRPSGSILLIEDADGVVGSTLARLREPIEAPVRCGGLAEALALIEQGAPDLVFLDLDTPAGRGLEGLDALVAVAPTLAVVAFGADADRSRADDAVRRGAQDHLVKSTLHPGMLGRVVRHAIERQRLNAGLYQAVRRAKTTENRLREASARLEAILGAVPLAVVQLDRTGCMLLSSRLPTFVEDEVPVGARFADHLPLEAGTRLQWHLHQAVLHQAHQRFEVTAALPDGRRGTWVVDLAPLVDESGDVPSVTACFRDVTEERLVSDRLAQADRMATVGILAAALTSEINNPMTAVLANTQTLRDVLPEVAERARAALPDGIEAEWLEELEQDLPDMVADVSAGAERVQRIVSDLHRYAAVTERYEVVIEPSRAIRAALSLARPALGPDVRVRPRLGSAPPVRVDESRFTQVIAQLLSNAAQAMDGVAAEERIIDVTLDTRDGGVVLAVRDRGPGVPLADRTRIFEPFFTTRGKQGGTGIGLAVARRMVAAWGGRLLVDDHADGGAIFTVVLPPAAAGEAARTRRLQARQGHSATPVPPRGRVALVAADPARREALRQTLANDHEVQVHVDVDAARRALGAGTTVDAVLVDVGADAGGIDGFARWMAQHRPDLAERTAFVAPARAGAASRRALAGRRDRVIEADAGPDAVRRLVGRLIAA